ncbi:MAG: hypothetical protein HY791_38230 [Deltaproteobacteria bacterium]|nr:hypothetical protein [Deltaproteobacteria bacterium]
MQRSWIRKIISRSAGTSVAGLVLAALGASDAHAQVTFGALSNFDVFNTTGEPTHGFEIELDGVSSSDVSYLFGAPYERYGDPKLVDFPGGVYVRYESPYDPANGAFVESTAIAPNPILPTDGHSCWNGANANYASSGCEHFGIGLNRNPTSTIYRWLVADPAAPGNLVASGTRVSIPAPVWNVAPAPANAVNQAPVVAAVIEAPPPEQSFEFGEPTWVKVYVTESPNPANLDNLLTDDPAVPQEAAETEVEWILMQTDLHSNSRGELINQAQMAEGDVSVTRRYEIYEYVGDRDPETNEARPAVSDSHPQPDELGNYLGAQMVAMNLEGAAAPLPIVVSVGPMVEGEVSLPYGDLLFSGGVPPFAIARTGGVLPAGLAVDVYGTVFGTPTRATFGPTSYSYSASDAAGQSVNGSAKFVIYDKVRITSPTLPMGVHAQAYAAQLEAAAGKAPYTWTLASGKLPPGFTFSRSGLLRGTSARAVSTTLGFKVTDALGVSVFRSLTLKVR